MFSGLGLQKTVDDVLIQSGIGEQHPLRSLAGKMSNFLIDSRSVNTSKKYFYAFSRWKTFCKFYDLKDLPAEPIHVALTLIDKKAISSIIDSVIYSIKWAHMLHGFDDPTENSFIKNLQGTAKRLNNNPVVKKDPVSTQMLVDLCTIYKDSSDLFVVRDLAMILIGFSGFLRFDELSNLKCRDITIFDYYLKILIPLSKTDQYRHDNELLISRGNTVACPLSMYKRYLFLTKLDINSDEFIFRPMFRSSGIAKLIYKNKKLSYTTFRENIVKRLKIVAPCLNLGLHSLRSGGATAAALSDVNERCLNRLARWKSDISKYGYIDDTFDKWLSVSKIIGL